MLRPPIQRLFPLSIAALLCCAISLAETDTRPNIVLILSDDAGYADFGFQSSFDVKTPNLDKLAKEGVFFSQAYASASICAPSRAGLMTGRYQQRFGYEDNIPHHPQPYLNVEELGLPESEITLGQYLQEAGYKTGYIGKWHLGEATKHHPLNRGFDYFYGFKRGFHDYFPNQEQQVRDPLMENFKIQEAPEYLTTSFGDKAVDFIQSNKKHPFFLYLAFNAVHTPMQAQESDLEQFKKVNDPKRKALVAMTYSMDREIGRVLDTLTELGLDENTLVIFFNDNGGSERNASDNFPLLGHKNTLWEGGIRVPMIIRWPAEGLTGGKTYSEPVIAQDIMVTCLDVAELEATGIKNPLDGVSLLPYLQEEKEGRPHQTLYWRETDVAAIRDGDWKLIRYPDAPAQLHKPTQDLNESVDFAPDHPRIVADLYKKLHNWEKEMAQPAWHYNRL